MLLRHEGFRKLCEARDQLRAVADEAPTIEAIAAGVGLSPAHFTKQFDALFGLTPHQFRIQARLERARLLLRLGQHSVTDVCMDVGFSSLGSFSTSFTRHVGESPSAYRRRMRLVMSVPGSSERLLVPGCLGLLSQLPADALVSFHAG